MARPETQYRPINFQQNDSWAKKFSTGQTTYTGIYLEFIGQPDFRLIKKGEIMKLEMESKHKSEHQELIEELRLIKEILQKILNHTRNK